ncbi:MAG: sulfite exporter TauE/SafE family protein, partial [Polyangiaceae bacterium]|nr:sulfite exporter TauE/SafE family protein [Polyangiaceae bacterium]
LQAHDLAGMFLLGLLGGGHCMGMCGPIALAMSPSMGSGRRRGAVVLYNAGRVMTYTVIGGATGALGASAGGLVAIARVQVWLALAAGLLLGWFGLALLRVMGEPTWLFAASGSKIPGVGPLMRRLAGGGGIGFALLLGLVLGFLPCGLSMAAFARALSAEGFSQGAALVAAFGVGTLPAMLLAGWLGHRLSAQRRKLGELLAGLVLVAMAVQHIARALQGLL